MAFARDHHGPLQQLPSLPQESLPAIAANSSAIGVYRITILRLAFPVPTPLVRFADVAANLDLAQVPAGVVAVIPLVRHHFGDNLPFDALGRLRIVRHFPQVLGRLPTGGLTALQLHHPGRSFGQVASQYSGASEVVKRVESLEDQRADD